MALKLVNAILALNWQLDTDWTGDGLPLVERVQALTEDKTITREQITKAKPDYTRQTAKDIWGKENNNGDDPDGHGEDGGPVEIGGTPPAAPDPEEPLPLPEADEVDIRNVPLHEIYGDLKLALQASEVLAEDMRQAMAYREEINAELAQISAKQEIIDRAIVQLSSGKKEPSGVSAYLKRQREIREARVGAAREFVRANTNRADILKELLIKSPVDAARAKQPKPAQIPVHRLRS